MWVGAVLSSHILGQGETVDNRDRIESLETDLVLCTGTEYMTKEALKISGESMIYFVSIYIKSF